MQNLVFGRVQGGDRDVDANAELFFHLLGNSECSVLKQCTVRYIKDHGFREGIQVW